MGGVLSRYILVEVLKSLALAFVSLAVVFLIGSLYELINKGASPRQMAIVLPYVIVYTLPFLLPVATIVGASLAYGRLAADNEVTPVVSGGIPASALALPAAFLGVSLSALLFGLEGSLIPYGWLKKKDIEREFIEQLTNLGEGENRPISSGDDFHFFCRRHSGSTVHGVEVIYTPGGTSGASLLHAPGVPSGDRRPVEIVAERGEIRRDEDLDAVVLELFDVSFTQFDPGDPSVARPSTQSAGPAPRAQLRRGQKQAVELPPRGAPSHGRFAYVSVAIPIDWRVKDRTEYRSTAALEALIAGHDRFQDLCRSAEAKASAQRLAALRLAAAIATPGAGPGGHALALASIGQATPGGTMWRHTRLKRHCAEGYLTERAAISTAPLLFALVGAAVPLLLRHPNRLLPLVLATALVSVAFFLPFLTARNNVDDEKVLASPRLYWVGPALTAALAAGVLFEARRR